jgi:hypothetical protein
MGSPPAAELLSALLVLALTVFIAVLVALSRLPRGIKVLVMGALALRLVGAFARYQILFGVYNGGGDAVGYYGNGLRLAARLWQLDFGAALPLLQPPSGHWWGTNFMALPSGIVLALIGPSMLGAFVVFSLLSFLGLAGFVVAFARMFPEARLSSYARWVWFLPSLWFWPSSIGKEAIVLLGIGLAVWGYCFSRERIHWGLMALGVLVVFAIRPQVAAVLLACALFGYWVAQWHQLSSTRIIQGVAFLLLGAATVWISLQQIGVEGFDVAEMQGYLETTVRSEGGSRIAMTGAGFASTPAAMVNVLFRPFPWEGRNPVQILSSLEVVAVWGMVLLRAGSLVRGIRRWRENRLMGAAVPFLILYSATLGMAAANLGIIARQRIFLLPFLFLLLEAGARRPARSHPVPVPGQGNVSRRLERIHA